MISLPQGQTWKVDQKSDLFGDIIATKNMDFDMEGYATIARKSNTITSSSSTSYFGTPLGMVSDGIYHYLFQTLGLTVYNFANSTTFASEIQSGGSTPYFDVYSDFVLFNGMVVYTEQSKIGVYSGGTTGTFTTKAAVLSVNYPHPMCVSDNNRLLVADGSIVYNYDPTFVADGANQLKVPNDYIITWMRSRQGIIYLGSRNIYGGEARMFVWNTQGITPQTSYTCGANWIYSGAEYDSSMVIITSQGRLLRFNGGGFTELASLPVYVTSYPWTSRRPNYSSTGKVANRGMGVVGDVLYINLDGSLDINSNEIPGTYLDGQPSGIWEYDPAIGLYHKAGLNADAMLQISPTALNSSNLTFAVPHQAQTGDPVLYSYAGTLTGLNAGNTYYAIVGSTTVAGLALTPADALAGRQVPIGGTPGVDNFNFITHTQEGAVSVTTPGFVFPINTPHLNSFFASDVLFGATVADSSMNTQNILGSFGTNRTRGSFTTAKTYSTQVLDDIQKLYTKFADLNLSTDEIVIKYRTNVRFCLPTGLNNGILTSATTMTADSNTQDIKNLQVGDEIEFIAGANAGYFANITAIDKTNTTYVFTFTESLNYAAGYTCQFIGNNWSKLNTDGNTSTTLNYASTTVGLSSTWYQFKFILRGNAISILQLKLINSIIKSAP